MTAYEPREYWSNVAEDIGRRADGTAVASVDSPFYRYKREQFVERFLRSIPARGRSVLEVGCGPGGNLRELARLEPPGVQAGS